MNNIDLMKYWFESSDKQVKNIEEVRKWLKEQ